MIASPLNAQQRANPESNKWGRQWKEHDSYPASPWPEDLPAPPLDLTVSSFLLACITFPEATGLGWDGMHTRALTRLSDSLVQLLVTVLLHCERVGRWPKSISMGATELDALDSDMQFAADFLKSTAADPFGSATCALYAESQSFPTDIARHPQKQQKR